MNKRLTPDQDLDRLLDEDGGEFAAIYRRLSRPEPPRRLDRSVLAEAARAVHGNRAPRAQRWALAMGSVTGVVLAAGIAWQVGQQMQSRESVPEGSRKMQDSRVVPVEAITESRPRQKAKSDLIMRDGEIPLEAREAVQEPLAGMSKQDKASAAAAEVMTPAAPAAAAPPPPRPATTRPEKPERSRSLEQSTRAEETSAAIAEMESDAFPADQQNELEESAPGAARTQPAARKAEPAAAGSAAALESRSAAAEPQAAAAPGISAEDSLSRNAQLPARAWLQEIERLASSGQRPEAIENLRLFRSRYPDWPLPDSLRQLDQ